VRAAANRRKAGAAFAVGLALGAAAVFVALGAIGAAVSGHWVVVAAVAVGALAVASDALGLRVRPQIHFQVPEPWRREMPVPRALFLYALLLGPGLTPYGPATAAWALPALTLALGDVRASLAIALGFAAGRALPVLVLAARGDETALAERPRGQRLLRVLVAASLLFALFAGTVGAAETVGFPANDPSGQGTALAWQKPGVGGFLERAGVVTQLPGNNPALGGLYVAWHVGPAVTIADRATLTPVAQDTLPGVLKLAVSRSWLAYRTATEIHVRPVGVTGPGDLLAKGKQPTTLGRPALGVDLVAFDRSSRDRSWITAVNIVSGRRLVLRSSQDDQLLNPSLLDGQLLYVRSSRCAQQLMLGPARVGGRDHVLYQLGPLAGQDKGHDPGHTEQGERLPCAHKPRLSAKVLWTTALSPTTAYVTVLRPGSGKRMVPILISVPRK